MAEAVKNTETAEVLDNKAALGAMRRFRIIDVNMVRFFFVVLFAVFIVALIPNLRIEYSEAEQRELAEFPKFTFSSLFSGEYFSDINLWFSDTFPFRDRLITLNSYMNSGFGGSKLQIHGDIEQGDKIPEVSEDMSSSIESEESVYSEETAQDTSSQETVSDTIPSEQHDSAQTVDTAPPVVTPPTPLIEQAGAILIYNDTAYEYYHFKQAEADIYSAAISRAADSLVGSANVYGIVVPTSIGITLPKDIAAGINSSDQKKAIDYMYSKLSPNVIKVNAYDTLAAHSSEYIYFRTDHHWTALGAYYTYRELMNVKGVKPNPLESFSVQQFPGFLGSFYRSSGKNPKLSVNPDTVFAYGSNTVNTMQITGVNNNGIYQNNFPIIRDGNALNESNKYLSFLMGDQPLGIIINPAAPEGTVCTVVKESYGYCFVPLLVDHYRTVYVIDYRYFSKVDIRKIQDFVAQTGTKDLIFINNISATRSAPLMNTLNSLIG